MADFEKRLNKKPFKVSDDLSEIFAHLLYLKSYKNKKKIEYYNIPCSFDIETTSFFVKDEDCITVEQWALLDDKSKSEYEKHATMYIWQLGLDGFCIYGRTWYEFISLLDHISNLLDLNEKKRIILYVHNLSFEFQWIKNLFEWTSIFATKPYMPLYAVCAQGFEFRCSYRNTNKSLDEVGKDLLKYKVKKAVGDLNYNLLRHSKTEINDTELGYCINDIKVVMCYIQEQIEEEGCVDAIPLTKTGYVRRDVKAKCFGTDKLTRFKYRYFIDKLRLDAYTYKLVREATLGGFTHANILFSRELCENVSGKDIASSYPAVMLSEMYPMSEPKKRDIKTLEEVETYCKYYCCIFTVAYEEIETDFFYDAYISLNRCIRSEEPVVDNGKVRSAKRIILTITNVDYWIIKKWYKYKYIYIKDFHTMIKEYLPKPIVLSILDYYEGKTKLKGVTGSEADYMRSKGMLNSIFGMCLTNIINDEIELNDGEWDTIPCDIEAEIEKYNNNRGRFLFYPWGTFVTAYARKNIISAIWEAGEDYIYTDTDSVKYLNRDKHEEFFEKYNQEIARKIDKCLNFYGIDPERSRPADSKGNKKQMGIFEDDGFYYKFKSLGAKRYLYEDDKGLHITVAGLGKKAGIEYLDKQDGNPFDLFDDDLEVPALETGKLTHSYLEKREGTLIDYQGNECEYHEKSSVHLAPCEFSMKLSHDYIALMKNLKITKGNVNLL